jgi:hypothetical protein
MFCKDPSTFFLFVHMAIFVIYKKSINLNLIETKQITSITPPSPINIYYLYEKNTFSFNKYQMQSPHTSKNIVDVLK